MMIENTDVLNEKTAMQEELAEAQLTKVTGGAFVPRIPELGPDIPPHKEDPDDGQAGGACGTW